MLRAKGERMSALEAIDIEKALNYFIEQDFDVFEI